MYELGALRALEEAVDGLDLNDAWSYVGVSAGSFIAACLANGLTMRQLLAAVSRDGGPFPLPNSADPEVNPPQEIFLSPSGGTERSYRGGGWYGPAFLNRSASRGGGVPAHAARASASATATCRIKPGSSSPA